MPAIPRSASALRGTVEWFRIVISMSVLIGTVEAGAADAPEPYHALHRKSPVGIHFSFDLQETLHRFFLFSANTYRNRRYTVERPAVAVYLAEGDVSNHGPS